MQKTEERMELKLQRTSVYASVPNTHTNICNKNVAKNILICSLHIVILTSCLLNSKVNTVKNELLING